MVGDARVQTEARENAIDRSVVVAAVRLPLAQLLGHRIAHEEGFRILREQRLARGQAVLNAAALRLDDPGDGTQDVYKRQVQTQSCGVRGFSICLANAPTPMPSRSLLR